MPSGDLLSLARSRALVTPELHSSNDFYGHACALKGHAGLPRRRSLKVVVEHGINFIDYEWATDATAGMPLFLCASPDRAAHAARSLPAGVEAVAIGPMIFYAPGGAHARPAPKRTLVAFPAHSTHHVDVHYDAERFAEQLAGLRSSYDEVKVCLYWRDVQRGLHAPFEACGLECTTAGHMYDPRFLVRLRQILDSASHVVTNEIGSHIIYAAALGRPVWVVDQSVDVSAEDDRMLQGTAADPASLAHERLAQMRKLFAEPREDLSAEQQSAVTELGGIDQYRSPPELRSLLDDAAATYRAHRPAVTRAKRVVRRVARNAVARTTGD